MKRLNDHTADELMAMPHASLVALVLLERETAQAKRGSRAASARIRRISHVPKRRIRRVVLPDAPHSPTDILLKILEKA